MVALFNIRVLLVPCKIGRVVWYNREACLVTVQFQINRAGTLFGQDFQPDFMQTPQRAMLGFQGRFLTGQRKAWFFLVAFHIQMVVV